MACGFAEVSYFLGLEWVGRFPSCSSSAAFVAGQKLQVGVVDNADRLGCLGILEKEGRPLPQWPSGWPRIVRMPFDAGGTCDWALSATVFFVVRRTDTYSHTHTHMEVYDCLLLKTAVPTWNMKIGMEYRALFGHA